MKYPAIVARFLETSLIEAREPLCLEVDVDGRLVDYWGCAARYGFEGLTTGQDLAAVVPLLSDYAADERVELPFVTDAGGRVSHIHIIPNGATRFLVYVDAEDEHEARRRLQQTAHEMRLLVERERRLIAELVDAQAELVVRRREAEEESRRRGRFIATMSHEFRSPLCSILAQAEQLPGEGQAGPAGEVANTVRRLVQQQLWLIDNLLLRGRMEAGGVVVRRSIGDLRELIDDLCLVFAPLAAERGLAFGARVGQDVPELLLLDELHLRQVLANVLGNAVKYTEVGAVELVAQWTDGTLRVEITDTGPGIPEADRRAVFRPFQRGRSEPRVLGSGLGLSITRRLVDAMEGTIELRSPDDGGTCVRVALPAPCPAELDDATDAEPAGAQVLVGDDDPDIADLLRFRLGQSGYCVRTEASGDAVVRSALATPPDLILLDVNLPGLDGPSAARELREAGFDAPIVALSAATSPRDVDYALSSGCSEFVAKPPQIDTLTRLIGRLIRIRRAGLASAAEPEGKQV